MAEPTRDLPPEHLLEAQLNAELQEASDRLEARQLDQISAEINAAWEGLADG